MAQFFSALFFSLAAAGAALFVFRMLRKDWHRVVSILGRAELEGARALAAPRVRIRVQAWSAQDRRCAKPLRAAA
jgi:hypothetical protein